MWACPSIGLVHFQYQHACGNFPCSRPISSILPPGKWFPQIFHRPAVERIDIKEAKNWTGIENIYMHIYANIYMPMYFVISSKNFGPAAANVLIKRIYPPPPAVRIKIMKIVGFIYLTLMIVFFLTAFFLFWNYNSNERKEWSTFCSSFRQTFAHSLRIARKQNLKERLSEEWVKIVLQSMP